MLAAALVSALVAPRAAHAQKLIFDRLDRQAGAPIGWSLVGQGSAATETPTETPTGTPTETPTVTPTRTLLPIGASCVDPTDCVLGNCVDDTCCVEPACPAGESCGNPGHLGECSKDPVAPAPAVSPGGGAVALMALLGIGWAGMLRRRRF